MESDTVVPVFTKATKIENKMSAIDLYYFPASPPTRAVLLLGRVLGLAFNLKLVNIMNGDQMKPEFLKINPMHTVPTIDDNGFVLWESRAIMQYMVDQYAKDDTLLPKNPKERAVVNQRLYMDSTLFARLHSYFFPIMSGQGGPSNEKKAKVEEYLISINKLLESSDYIAGYSLTIADISLVATISTVEAVQFDLTEYPKLDIWYKRIMKNLEGYGYDEINKAGADMIAQAFKNKLADL